jgi:hypothetical protein
VAPAQKQVVGVSILRVAPRERLLAFRRQARLDLLGDRSADLLLQAEDAAVVAVERVGPDLYLIARPNQPGGDSQLAALRAKGALDEVVGAEFPANLRQRFRGALIRPSETIVSSVRPLAR